jgi:hypothetical protein
MRYPREKLSERLSTLGQMAVFMLAVALSTPLNVLYEDIMGVKERFSAPPYNYTLTYLCTYIYI